MGHTADSILEILKDGKIKTIDEIAEIMGTHKSNVNSAMVSLERFKIVKSDMYKNYSLREK